MFTDTDVLQAMAYDRSIRATVSDAQGLVNRKNAQIASLRRQLSTTQRELAAARAEIEQMRTERGQAGLDQLQRMRALRGSRTH